MNEEYPFLKIFFLISITIQLNVNIGNFLLSTGNGSKFTLNNCYFDILMQKRDVICKKGLSFVLCV